jgi:opacity protein-like surface antigen
MGRPWSSTGLIAVGMALAMSAPTAQAQTDTTRRVIPDSLQVRSERIIPVQKDQTRVRRSSTGEVVTAMEMRLDSIAAAAAADRARLDSIVAAASATASRLEEHERSIGSVRDSLGTVRGELTTVRGELTTVGNRATALGDSVTLLSGKVQNLRNRLSHGSIFGNSGFYVGIGTGANFTMGNFSDIGYHEGLNVSVPIGWHKRESMWGIRAELAAQTFEGRSFGSIDNADPKLYSGEALLTLNLPINSARSSFFYLMGGGGMFMFRDVNAGSMLAGRLGSTAAPGTGSITETKFGWSVGAGAEFHILGATSLFVQSKFTNVMADETTIGSSTSSSVRWIPVVVGLQVR